MFLFTVNGVSMGTKYLNGLKINVPTADIIGLTGQLSLSTLGRPHAHNYIFGTRREQTGINYLINCSICFDCLRYLLIFLIQNTENNIVFNCFKFRHYPFFLDPSHRSPVSKLLKFWAHLYRIYI